MIFWNLNEFCRNIVPGAWEICSILLGSMFQPAGKYVPGAWNDISKKDNQHPIRAEKGNYR